MRPFLRRIILRRTITCGDALNLTGILVAVAVGCLLFFRLGAGHADVSDKLYAGYRYAGIVAREDSARADANALALSRRADSLLALSRRADSLLARADTLLRLQADSTGRARQEARFAEMRRAAEGNALAQWFLMLENGQERIRAGLDSVAALVDSVRTESRLLAERNLSLSLRMADSARMVRAALVRVQAQMSRRPAYADSLLRTLRPPRTARPAAKNKRPRTVRHRKHRLHRKPNPDG